MKEIAREPKVARSGNDWMEKITHKKSYIEYGQAFLAVSSSGSEIALTTSRTLSDTALPCFLEDALGALKLLL